MGDLGTLWISGVVQPLVNALVFLHALLVERAGFSTIPLLGDLSWGLTIILFTLVVKSLTIPLTVQQLRSARAMQILQPQLKELQKQFSKDRERLMQEQMRLYRENKINPAAGCLPMVIQMPIWIGLYSALMALAQNYSVYGFVGGFLWLPSLAAPEPFPQVLAVLTGVTQWIVQRMMTPRSSDPQQQMMNQMMQFMPIMFVFFAFQVSSGLVIYWVTSNLFSIIQQYFMMGWGSLLPLPFLGGSKATASSGVAKIEKPSTNGREAGNRLLTSGEDKAEIIDRGPGGGKKKRMKRR